MLRKLALATILPACPALQVSHAQSTFGDLRGVTRDPSGLPLTNAAVTVEIGVEEESITVRVRNEGGSIAPQDQDRIFERFYRGTDARKLVSGAGLGLHVARKIAVAHGGNLVLDKSASPGTVVFCLKLPMLNDGSHHVPTDY